MFHRVSWNILWMKYICEHRFQRVLLFFFCLTLFAVDLGEPNVRELLVFVCESCAVSNHSSLERASCIFIIVRELGGVPLGGAQGIVWVAQRVGLGPKWTETHVLQVNFCGAPLGGAPKGGSHLGGPSKISGWLKIIYVVHFPSKPTETHVLQVNSCGGRVQSAIKGGGMGLN